MSKRVEDFINANLKMLERTEKEAILDSLGLYELEKEYAAKGTTEFGARSSGYTQVEKIDGITYWYKLTKKKYPEVTDKEFEQLKMIAAKKANIRQTGKTTEKGADKNTLLKFRAEAQDKSSDSFAASFMKANAWIIWIGGLMVAILASFTEIETRYYPYTETTFSWKMFLAIAFVFYIAGCPFMCLAELFGNVESIKNRLYAFSIKQEIK